MAKKTQQTPKSLQPLSATTNQKKLNEGFVTQIVPIVVEEYKPSDNAKKYPEEEKSKKQYKILASRNDYVRLQEEVVKHLNDGWQLVGGVSNSTSVGQYESVTIFVQAVTK